MYLERQKGSSMGQSNTKKGRGGLGIRDFRKLDGVADVKDALKIWDEGGSEWSRWMRDRYVGDKSLDEIGPKLSDSLDGSNLMCKAGKKSRSGGVEGRRRETLGKEHLRNSEEERGERWLR